MRMPSPPYGRLDLTPPSADQFIFGVAPLDYGPVLLRRPFGFRLAADTLPSGNCERWLQVRLGCLRLSSSCPVRLLHTFPLSRPARNYPRLWLRPSSFERRRDLNAPESRAAQRAVRLVDVPAPSNLPFTSATEPLGKQGCEPLFPLPHCFMAEFEAAQQKHFGQILQTEFIPEPAKYNLEYDVG